MTLLVISLLSLCHTVQAQSRAWAWMGGSNSASQPGVYGTLGVPAAGNFPGARAGAVTSMDSNGNVWLFGGEGFDVNGRAGYLNDLWKYTPSTGEWTWISGSNTAGQQGVYYLKDGPWPSNMPGGREWAVGWTDASGNFWLFGGFGLSGGTGGGRLNDLWEYTPSIGEWTWVGGTSAGNQPGSYGALGAGGEPGARMAAVGWRDASGNLWLFGGNGFDVNSNEGGLNDLWEYTPSTNPNAPPTGEWTWVGGSNTVGEPGSYRALGSAGEPGARTGAVAWTDPNGNLWLFGGDGSDANSNEGELNDLWEYTPTTGEWTWMDGSDTQDQAGVYGTLGVPNASNMPSGRAYGFGWIDTSGNLWLFGGADYRVLNGYLNDLWEYVPSTGEWAWMNGSDTPGQLGVYGVLGDPAAGNEPGARNIPVGWTDKAGNLWLLGGQAYYANGNSGLLNDLWEYTTLPAAATPTFSPAAGTYTSVQTVTISDATTGATIYYTTDGTTPTTNSTVYSGPITVSSSEAIEAIAAASGYSNSAVASATYTINISAAAPVLSPAAGTYTSIQTVTISDATDGATIYYTTNGTTPTTSSTVYSGPITVSSSETIEAIAAASGYSNSAVASATYTINLPVAATPKFSPAAGTYTSAQTVTISASTLGATIYYTTNGTTPTTSSTKYTGPITVSTTETVEALATAPGYATSTVASGAYTITVPGFTLSASPSSVSVAEGNSATSAITVTDLGGFSGSVTLSAGGLPSGVTASFAAGSGAGTQVLTLAASTSAAVNSTPVTVTVTGISGPLSATASIALTITPPPFGPGNGGTTSITVTSGSTTGNTGTVSVVGATGFSGTVNLTCNVTTSISGVNDLPTCSLNPASVTLSGATAQTSTLTVTTTAASSAANTIKNPFLPSAGGSALAAVLFLLVPRRRRYLLAVMGFLVLVLATGLVGCGGGGGGSSGGNSGTTAGTYTITVTGTSGTISASVGTVALTVQ
ncbi:chitobiase/beta-hexosaminidase C-terminal domain-containing protein [Acidicapsa acidisoli]|uniref:chitobiase/beta-hexosaminidase C-terminal domain-containing protein n=1 Tax=Acidicapsa acidisoli TaxID=1615681 RepID=UPI0021DF50B8|nr:chitobiase/beta-hexosaminidase C-terminal domain-containing protein [Acidicapsa acidisoli]